jgi:hypothetical protein
MFRILMIYDTLQKWNTEDIELIKKSPISLIFIAKSSAKCEFDGSEWSLQVKKE